MTNKDGGPLAVFGKPKPVTTAEMRNHAWYMESYDEPFVGSQMSVAHALYSAADQIDALAARATPQPDPVREELVEAIEGLLRADLGAYDKAQRTLSKAKEGQS